MPNATTDVNADPTSPTGAAPAQLAEGHRELVRHVARTTHLPAGVAQRVVDDVVAFFDETVETVVRRRHRELQAAGWANAEIFDRLAAELAVRPVRAPQLSARQLRRIVYG